MFSQRNVWFAAAPLFLAVASAAAWEIPLTLDEQWDFGAVPYITGGVPLLAGQAKEASELRLAVKDADGKLTAVPAQFRVLARWWRADNSIRWVLVDWSARIRPSRKTVFYLTNAKLAVPSPKAVLSVGRSDEAITITTGPARFVIDRKKFAFLRHAYIDEDKNGEFTAAEDLLATTADCGTVIEDTYGRRYFSGEGTRSVEVIESGPMRVCVRARGVHRARGGAGYKRGMYSYDYIMNFYAGSSDVNVDLVIGNNPAKSAGSPTFEDASLQIVLAGGATGSRLYGAAPLDGKLTDGESVCLYQDSNGAETWNVPRCSGYSTGTRTAGFRGYRIIKRNGGKEEIITQGDHARGVAHIFNDRGGLIVHTRNFWQQFPKAVEVSADGSLRLGLFPREYRVPHYLEDASGKGHEIILHFYSRKRSSGYASGPARRTWPHLVATLWDNRVYPRPPLTHIAATGALTDVGPFTVPTRGLVGYPSEHHARRLFMLDKYKGHAYGWQVYGSRWETHGGHSSRGARKTLKHDNYLYRWLVTGNRGWLAVGNDRSRHFRDVRCYRIEDQDPFSFKDWAEFRQANRSEDYTKRPQPQDEQIKKYSQGFWGRSTWWLPNPAHIALDMAYDRYLLFGDVRAFENMRIIAAHGGYFVAYQKPFVHRQTGWSWRALERYWELTGDKDAEACLMKIIKNYEPLIGKKPLGGPSDGVNYWFTQVFSRAIAMTALHTGDKRMLELCRTLAVGKDRQRAYYCTLFSVLYHLTGEQKYKKLVFRDGTGEGLLVPWSTGDYPATAHWLLNQPPKKK